MSSVKTHEKAYAHALSYLLAVMCTDVANIVVNSSLFPALVRSLRTVDTDVLCVRFAPQNIGFDAHVVNAVRRMSSA